MKTFGEPVNKFKDNVTATEARMETLKNNLEDLRNHSENAQQMVNILIFPFFTTMWFSDIYCNTNIFLLASRGLNPELPQF